VEKITLTDVMGLPEYEAMRDAMRSHVIELKKQRRVPLGDRISLVFENRETVLYQIQEMVRAEHITSADAIQAEIDVYGPSIPERNQLSATMFIEITEQDAIRSELDRLIGVNERLRLRIGERQAVPGVFEPGWSREDRIAAVQYVKFPLTPEQAEAFKNGHEPVFIEVDHPSYQASTRIDEAVRRELAREIG
jgi:hypothetical protein